MELAQNTPDITVVIVNWNTKQLLTECLLSVKENLKDLLIETIIVDNGSTDGSKEIIRQDFENVYLIENQENNGFAKANNQAFRISHGQYILLLNSDAAITPNAIQTMYQIMETDETIGIAGARLIYPDGRQQVSHGPLPTFWTEIASLFGLDNFGSKHEPSKSFLETGTVNGACMLIRKTLLDQIGMFDEIFFMFSEEIDLCNRCHQFGKKVVFIHSAMVIHNHAGSTGQTVKRVTNLYTSKLRYFHKHFGTRVGSNLKQIMLMTSICKFILYKIVRVFSLGTIRKEQLWYEVSRYILAMPK